MQSLKHAHDAAVQGLEVALLLPVFWARRNKLDFEAPFPHRFHHSVMWDLVLSGTPGSCAMACTVAPALQGKVPGTRKERREGAKSSTKQQQHAIVVYRNDNMSTPLLRRKFVLLSPERHLASISACNRLCVLIEP